MNTVQIGRDLEQEAALIFTSYGYLVQHRGGSGDDGVDLALSYPGQVKYGIVQCKAYEGSLPPTHIRALYGTLLHESADEAWLITTGVVTQGGLDWAAGKPIYVVDARTFGKWRNGACLEAGQQLLRFRAELREMISPGCAMILGIVLALVTGLVLWMILPEVWKPAALLPAAGIMVWLPVANWRARVRLQRNIQSLRDRICIHAPHRGLIWVVNRSKS